MNAPTLNEIAGYKEPAHLISVINDLEEKLLITENLLSFFKKESNKNEELTLLRAELERADAIYQRSCEVEHELRAELAAERARLDWLEQRGPWDSWIKPPEEGLTLRAPIRAAIDSAMQEGA